MNYIVLFLALGLLVAHLLTSPQGRAMWKTVTG